MTNTNATVGAHNDLTVGTWTFTNGTAVVGSGAAVSGDTWSFTNAALSITAVESVSLSNRLTVNNQTSTLAKAVSIMSTTGGFVSPVFTITGSNTAGGTYLVNTAGNISIDTLTATNADGSIETTGGRLDGTLWRITKGALQAQAQNDIALTGSLIADNTNAAAKEISFTSAGGGFTSPIVTVTGGSYAVNTDKDIAIGTLTATDADGEIGSANGKLDGTSWSIESGALSAQAKNDITLTDGLRVDNSAAADKLVSMISLLGGFSSDRLELTGGLLKIAVAGDIRINSLTAIDYESIAISSLRDGTGYLTYDNENLASGGGSLSGGTWSLKNAADKEANILAYAGIHFDDSITLDNVKVNLASTTMGFTAQAVNVLNGSSLNLRAASDIAIDHLKGRNSRIYMTSLHKNGRSTGSRAEATGGGKLAAASVELISCESEITVFEDIVISEKLEASEDEEEPDPDPSICTITSVHGGFTLIDGASETYLRATDTLFALHTAKDIAIDHVAITDGSATFTALADLNGLAVNDIASAAGGGDFFSKTVRIVNNTADHDTAAILAWMDLVIANDENDDGNGMPDNNVLSAVNAGAGSLTLTLTAVKGNLLSDSWFDSWYFDNTAATITAGGSIVAQDTISVLNGSNVAINATTDAFASIDIGGKRYAVYEDGSGVRYYTIDPSLDGDWYTMSVTLPYHLEKVYLTTWTPSGAANGTLYLQVSTASLALSRVYGGTFTCADYIWDSDGNRVVNGDDNREESAVTVDDSSVLSVHTAHDATAEHLDDHRQQRKQLPLRRGQRNLPYRICKRRHIQRNCKSEY